MDKIFKHILDIYELPYNNNNCIILKNLSKIICKKYNITLDNSQFINLLNNEFKKSLHNKPSNNDYEYKMNTYIKERNESCSLPKLDSSKIDFDAFRTPEEIEYNHFIKTKKEKNNVNNSTTPDNKVDIELEPFDNKLLKYSPFVNNNIDSKNNINEPIINQDNIQSINDNSIINQLKNKIYYLQSKLELKNTQLNSKHNNAISLKVKHNKDTVNFDYSLKIYKLKFIDFIFKKNIFNIHEFNNNFYFFIDNLSENLKQNLKSVKINEKLFYQFSIKVNYYDKIKSLIKILNSSLSIYGFSFKIIDSKIQINNSANFSICNEINNSILKILGYTDDYYENSNVYDSNNKYPLLKDNDFIYIYIDNINNHSPCFVINDNNQEIIKNNIKLRSSKTINNFKLTFRDKYNYLINGSDFVLHIAIN